VLEKRKKPIPKLGIKKISKRLAKGDRLLKKEDFDCFWENREVLSLSFCTVFRSPNSKKAPRLGITIKVRARSVDRNKTKRVIREFFRQTKELLGGYDYNFLIFKQASLKYPFSRNLKLELEKHLVKALQSGGTYQFKAGSKDVRKKSEKAKL